MKLFLIFISIITSSLNAHATVLPGWFDLDGTSVHTADEVDVQVNTVVTKVPQGYQYNYSITSLPSSLQNIIQFEIAVSDPYSVVVGSESSPWARSQGSYPNKPNSLAASDPTFIYTKNLLTISWVNFFSAFSPGVTLSGFTFTSPYPPKITIAHIRGDTEEPVFQDEEQELPEFYNQTIYGPGKIIPVIGPVKPTTPNVTDNYVVLGCVGGLCDVQLDITGPMDPYGNVYTYQWTGAFGAATGAKPVVQLAAGNYNVSLAVSDPYTTLVTATMPITVVDPNPPLVTPPTGGNNGGGANGGNAGNRNGDIDHDGIPDDEDGDRDGDGKPNDQDDDPDHPD